MRKMRTIVKMRRHPIVSFFTLAAVYAVIIIGLFIIQFRTDNSISRSIGNLLISLAREEDASVGSDSVSDGTATISEESARLKNTMSVSFRGITFSADDSKPVKISSSKGGVDERNLVLDSWSETDSSARFSFTDGSSLSFTVDSASPEQNLVVSARPAEGYDTMSIPYAVNSGYAVSDQTEQSLTLSRKNAVYVFSAPSVSSDRIVLKDSLMASYAPYVEEKPFEYASVEGLSGTDDTSYSAALATYRQLIADKFSSYSSGNTSIAETDVLVYVAEMGSRGSFPHAVQTAGKLVPAAKRTFLTAPYFGNLTAMGRGLSARTLKFASDVKTAVAEKDLSIFTIPEIQDYAVCQRKTQAVRDLMAFPAQISPFNPSIDEASGLLSLYAKIRRLDKALAAKLDPVISLCLATIAGYLHRNDDTIVFKEEDGAEPLTLEQKVRAGQALIDFGSVRNKTEYTETGRLLISQELKSCEDESFPTISELYPVIVKDNPFYPHVAVLGYYGERPVWAWTCASAIDYSIKADGVVDMNITFPLENSHFMIVTGVPDFHSQIEIQKLRFRTDPRFEAYNSSGYAYDQNGQMLFLKSRHKSRIELIRLFCDPVTDFVGPDDSIASMQKMVQEMGVSDVTIKQSDEGLVLSVEKIQFEAESAVLRPSEYPKIEKIAQILKSYPDNDIMVSGHTAKSNIGRPAQPLSEERADAVADYLVQLGVRTRDHIQTQGYGDTRPISPNDTEEERSKNRRVEITILNN